MNPVTGVKIVIHRGDFPVRGSGVEGAKFHTSLEDTFDCRPWSRPVLTPVTHIEGY